MENKTHWENVFATKSANEVSWTQENPASILSFLEEIKLPKTANIIDVGGGESFLAEILLNLGYQNIWVLDISEKALEKAKARLGEKAHLIKWIVSDITDFQEDTENNSIKFDFWNDRAVFHFLTDDNSIKKYINVIEKAINTNGYFLLGTFSENGPLKCSGLNIKQYSENSMKNTFQYGFKAIKCFTEAHTTPFNTIQNFQFCGFVRK
jgi:2-polyprenyl-3-methyl-5-hydroxy-6-metoxy-1,4-benzoquinol methylase